MQYLARELAALRSDNKGITALEYGIVAGWLAFVIVLAFQNFATSLSGIFSRVGTSL